MESLINVDSIVTVPVVGTPHAAISSEIQKSMDLKSQIINPTVEMIGDIGYFKNAISPEAGDYIVKFCEARYAWKKSVTVGEAKGLVDAASSPRQSSTISISGLQDLKDVDSFIHKAFVTCIAEYKKNFIEDLGISHDEGYGLLKYEKGGYYRVHIDYTSNSAQQNIRALSGLIYLNDNYKGGEIMFPRQGVKIKPNAGSIVLFPGIFTHPHTSLDIEDGIKYCVVTWWK
jgi:hypothetical protein